MEKKRCEGELKEKLAEVEGRDKAREAMPTQVEKTVSDGSDTVEKGNRKGKDTSVRAKQRAIGKISTAGNFGVRRGRMRHLSAPGTEFFGERYEGKRGFSFLSLTSGQFDTPLSTHAKRLYFG